MRLALGVVLGAGVMLVAALLTMLPWLLPPHTDSIVFLGFPID